MQLLRQNTALREILRPIGQLFAFIFVSGLAVSVFVLVVAFLLRGTQPNRDLVQLSVAILPQVLIDGITLGFMYATIALGYTMVYGVLEFINFAHGEFFMWGAFGGTWLLIYLDNRGILNNNLALDYLFLFLAIIVGMIVAGTLSVSVERIAYRPLRHAPRLVPLISAIGVSFLLQDTMRFIQSITTGQFYLSFPTFGNFDERIPLFTMPLGPIQIPVDIQVKSLIVIVVAFIMLIGLNFLVNATKLGKAIRAVAQDQRTSSLMGINVNRIIAFTFLIGGALGGAAGVLWALKFTRIDPFMGFIPGLKAFTAAVLGGIGNITGAMLGGIILGLLESVSASYLTIFTQGAFGAEYKDIVAFGILILILIFRPTGLLGENVAQKA